MVSIEIKNAIHEILEDEVKFKFVSDQIFKQVDSDGSGQVEIDEFLKAFEGVFNELKLPLLAKQQEEEFFKLLDADGSGKLSSDELSVCVKMIFQKILASHVPDT